MEFTQDDPPPPYSRYETCETQNFRPHPFQNLGPTAQATSRSPVTTDRSIARYPEPSSSPYQAYHSPSRPPQHSSLTMSTQTAPPSAWPGGQTNLAQPSYSSSRQAHPYSAPPRGGKISSSQSQSPTLPQRHFTAPTELHVRQCSYTSDLLVTSTFQSLPFYTISRPASHQSTLIFFSPVPENTPQPPLGAVNKFNSSRIDVTLHTFPNVIKSHCGGKTHDLRSRNGFGTLTWKDCGLGKNSAGYLVASCDRGALRIDFAWIRVKSWDSKAHEATITVRENVVGSKGQLDEVLVSGIAMVEWSLVRKRKQQRGEAIAGVGEAIGSVLSS